MHRKIRKRFKHFPLLLWSYLSSIKKENVEIYREILSMCRRRSAISPFLLGTVLFLAAGQPAGSAVYAHLLILALSHFLAKMGQFSRIIIPVFCARFVQDCMFQVHAENPVDQQTLGQDYLQFTCILYIFRFSVSLKVITLIEDCACSSFCP